MTSSIMKFRFYPQSIDFRLRTAVIDHFWSKNPDIKLESTLKDQDKDDPKKYFRKLFIIVCLYIQYDLFDFQIVQY